MLIDYCPRVVGQIREIKEICKAEQPEFDEISKEPERLLANRFVSTSDKYGITRFEEELGIVPQKGKSLDEQRIAILVKMIKKNLSFSEVLQLIRSYSQDIDLVPNYDTDELEIIIRGAADPRIIYEVLDNILSLNVFITTTCESTNVLNAINPSVKMDLETSINYWKNKRVWYLDGSVKLDGSRKLDSIPWKQPIAIEAIMSARITETFEVSII